MPKLKCQSQEQRHRHKMLSQDHQRKHIIADKKTGKSTNLRQQQYLSFEENMSKHKERMKKYKSAIEVRDVHKKEERIRLSNVEEHERHLARLSISQAKRLQDDEHRQIHQERLRESQKKRLLDPDQREKHQEIDREAHKKRLLDPEQRQQHQQRLGESQKKRLLNAEERKIHQQRLRESQKKRLLNAEERKVHQQRLRESQKKRLLNAEERKVHQQRLRESQEKRLLNAEERKVHQQRLRESQKGRLLDPDRREKHQERDREAHRKRLLDPEKKEQHQQRLRQSQDMRLQNPEERKVHQQRLRQSQKARLSNPQSRAIQLKRLQESQNKRQNDLTQRQLHILRVTEARRKRSKDTERQRRNTLFEKCISLKKEGPTYECVSCCRLWFKTSVKFFKTEDLRCSLVFLKAACNILDSVTVGHLCRTCEKSIKSNKIPTLSMSNEGLVFPVVSSEISKLSDLEERFLCPRIPFMVIRAVVGDQQYVVKGRAVNVPTDVENSVRVLPRVSSECMVIPICFRRKKAYKSNVMFENVRPKVIQEAGKMLENSPVFLHCGIKLNLDRLDIGPTAQANDGDDDLGSNSSDSSEDEEPINIVDEATLLLTEAMVFAPGEGKKPVSLFDEYAEALSFVKIYGGQLVKQPRGITYQNWIKSEIMRSDRRCANVTKLFFSALKLRSSKVASSINFCLRKAKTKSTVTVQDMLDENFVKNLELYDSGFKVFATDRGAPAYWEERKKEVFAMIRQLGPPSIFLTMSPAETRWLELIVILKKVVDGEYITPEQAETLEYKEKARLIRSDPVTLARYFDYRMRQFFCLLKEKNSIFCEYSLLDFYIRTEFQQRGSPHCHCLLWLSNAPKYSEEDTENSAVTAFIDRFISCSNQIPEKLLELQTHKHTFTCRKGTKKTKCRFDIPFFPLYETCIFLPLKDVEKPELTAMRQQRQQIQEYLANAHKNKVTLTIEEMLHTLQLTYALYIRIIRSGISRPTVMLRRKPEECMTNFYNGDILKLHLANMDIQFITDMYSCASYVLNYLNKSNRGLSKLLHDAVSEVRKGNYTMKEQLRMVANQFLKASEFSAQEAVYYILALPLSKSSRQCTFINTSPPEKRVAVVKSKKDLEALPPNSTDIYVRNIIDHYARRPSELEHICLASVVAWYTFSSTNRQNQNKIPTSDEDNTEEEENLEEHTVLKLNDGSGYLHRRRKARIIRFVRFNEHTDNEDFIRENVMLFVPWRDESDMIKSSKYLFTIHQDLIRNNRAEFVFNEDIENILQEVVAQRDENDDSDDELHTPLNLGVFCDFSQEGDIAVDMNDRPEADATANKQDVYFPVPHMISEEDYADLVCTLNEKQRAFLLHVLHCFKSGFLPLYHCVLGGAGVGKSRLIEAIHQTLLRFINTNCTNLDSLKVLLCAPTGKAAFGIKGTTLHAAFVLPLNQCSADLIPLSSSTRNTLLTKLRDLSLIIIDEISMVGSRMIQQVDCRLKQVFQTSKPFAGISVIVFGDFNQLAPVGDRYIFESNASDPYGAIVGNPIWRLFTSFHLTEIMRQKDDAQFARALNNLANGSLTLEQVHLLESRIVSDADKVPRKAIRLFRSNAEVDSFNKQVIEEDPMKQVVEAVDKITGKASESMKVRLYEKVKSSAIKDTQGLPFQLALSIGIKYMLTVNVDVEDGLVNGAVGVLKGYDCNSSGHITRIWLLFSDQYVGKKRRREIKKQGEDNWIAIDKIKRNIRPTKSVVSIIRHQFPAVPAEAITIYKSQGGTYNSVAVKLTRGLRRNELYVALSRCTELSGLHLIGVFKPPSPPSPYDKLQMEMKRIMNAPLTMACYFPSSFPDKDSIVYQNIQSLLKESHWRDLNNFIVLQKPCIFIAAETWTKAEDDVNIPDYTVAHRVNVATNHRKHAYGLAIYCKTDQRFTVIFSYNEEHSSKACCLVVILYKDIAVCTGYKPPSTPYSVVQHQFEDMVRVAKRERNKIVVLGDFNIDLKMEHSHPLFRMLKSSGLSASTFHSENSTTNSGTTIDVVFSNFDFFCGVSETLFGYHKQLLCIPEAPSGFKDNDQIHVFAPPEGTSDLTLLEATEEGKWLQKKIQRTGELNDSDIQVVRRLCTFLRQGIYRPNFLGQARDVNIPVSLKPYFMPIKTKGDGNCFYYAISLLLTGKDSLMSCLRAVEAAYIIANEEFLDNLPLRLGATIFIKNVLRSGTFAELGDVLLTSLILQRPINVYTGCDTSSMRFAPIHSEHELHLYLDMISKHYTAVVPKSQHIPLPPTVQIPQMDFTMFTLSSMSNNDARPVFISFQDHSGFTKPQATKGNQHFTTTVQEIKQVSLSQIVSNPDRDANVLTQSTVRINDSKASFIPIQEGTKFTLREASEKGALLKIKIQSIRKLDDNDIDIARKLCAFIRQGVYKAILEDECDDYIPASLRRYFTPIRTTGDGNCFYYAVSLLLSGNENLMSGLRALEAAHIIINQQFLISLPHGIGAAITLTEVLRDGTYAEFGDVLLIALILQRPINVYTGNDNSSMRFAPIARDDELHVYLDMTKQHYTALVPKIKQIPLPRDLDMDGFDNNSFVTFS